MYKVIQIIPCQLIMPKYMATMKPKRRMRQSSEPCQTTPLLDSAAARLVERVFPHSILMVIIFHRRKQQIAQTIQ